MNNKSLLALRNQCHPDFIANHQLQMQLIMKQLYEKKDTFIKTTNAIAWTIPEVSLWTFSSYEVLLPFLLAYFRNAAIPQFNRMDKTWNIIDGVASIGIGVTQFADDQTHRPLISKIKGIINICSGTQLLVLTAMASPAIPFAFAAAAIIDFLLSLEPLLHSLYRCYFFSYWLNDSLKQLAKLEENYQKVITEKIEFNVWITEYEINEVERRQIQWIAEQREQRIEAIGQEFDNLKNQISIRLANNNSPDAQRLLADPYWQSTVQIQDVPNIEQEKIKITEELQHELYHHAGETFVFCLAAVGWTLFCIPGMQIPAAILIGITALLYIAKNASTLATYIQSTPTCNANVISI
ncbi:MAG: hypothetical protein Q8R83_08080 [Legionellaceae bacterium]|nr:hypothetical protein [Legionellaceae bacterium]